MDKELSLDRDEVRMLVKMEKKITLVDLRSKVFNKWIAASDKISALELAASDKKESSHIHDVAEMNHTCGLQVAYFNILEMIDEVLKN